MKKAKETIYAPWQHRFIAGIFGQLGLFSDRDVALYLQRESSFPKDGMAEAIFRSFAKGIGKFPKAWKEVLLKNCNQAFIDRWQENIFNSPLNQEDSNKKNIAEDHIGARKASDKTEPKLIKKQTPKPLIKKAPEKVQLTEKQPPPSLAKESPEKITPPASELNETIEANPQGLILEIPTVPQTNQSVEMPNNQAEIKEPVSLVEKTPEEIIPPMEESNEASDIIPQELLGSETTVAPQNEQLSETTPDEPETEEVNPLPESIIKILTVSLSESLEKDGKLNPRKLVRALNTRSNSYKIKRTEREIFFQGKRVTHKFTIPSEIEITAQ